MTQTEALKMALDALEDRASLMKWQKARDAVKEALAQPEQEPEWYHGVDEHGCNRFYHKTEVRPSEFKTPLYTAPPQRKPLPPQSPCEMTQAEGKMFKLGWLECEAAHGIKENT